MVQAPPFVRALLEPEAYPEEERPREVRLVETHISWLFLTGRFVYKVKKPVNFGFLDFTALEGRRHFCHEEVRLNRRLSPDVYLGVVEVVRRGGRYALYGAGEVVDYAVRMRQLPGDRWLSVLLERGQAGEAEVRRVARRIARFHRSAETGPEVTRTGALETVRFNAEENFRQTEPYIGRTLDRPLYERVRAYTRAFLEVREPLFRRREREGRIRDGHGDLHAAQINLEDGIAIIDCIEFNTRFRYGDVAADLAFLAMDLDRHGRPDLERVLVEEWVRETGDRGALEVLPYYKCYRAYVRGKVESFRLDEPGLPEAERTAAGERARRYFALAGEYARLRGPALLLTAGLMGTGKSTLARGLAEALGARLLSSDVVRKELAGIPPEEHRYEPWGEGIYSPSFTERTYRELHGRARALLRRGEVVVVDASYRARAWREEARRVAEEVGAPFWVVETACPEGEVLRRLAGRLAGAPTASDGRPELLSAQRAHFEPLEEVPVASLLRVDTSGPPEASLASALHELYRRWLAGAGTEGGKG